MNINAMNIRTKTVNTNGKRFVRWRVQSVLNSSEWFFFITKARKKGAMRRVVRSPQIAFPIQCSPVISIESLRKIGKTIENIMMIVAAESML